MKGVKYRKRGHQSCQHGSDIPGLQPGAASSETSTTHQSGPLEYRRPPLAHQPVSEGKENALAKKLKNKKSATIKV